MKQIDEIRELQSQRVNLMKAELRLKNQQAALVRRVLGYSWELPEADQAKIKKEALKVVGTFNKTGAAEGLNGLSPVLMAYKLAFDPIVAQRDVMEKEMVKRAEKLDAMEWVKEIRGMGALGLALIVGEAGDLGKYPNPAKLWKRFGLAVMDGKRQGAPGKDATADEWSEHGYCPRRRSVIWTIGDSLLRAQVRNVKDADGERTDVSEALGVYGQVYLDRKRYELDRMEEPKKMLAHNRAKRYVEKKLLKDLWNWWNGVEEGQLAGVTQKTHA